MRGKVFVLCVVAAGCTDAGGSDVDGNVVHRFFQSSGQSDVVPDLTGFRYQVYAAGELIPAQPVAGTANGTFRIAGVPDGPFLLRVTAPNGSTTWSYETQHDISITEQYVGRPDAVASSGSLPLELHLTGVAPWGDRDYLVVNCWENGTENSAPDLTPTIPVGASSIDATLDWSSGYSFGPAGKPYLMDPAAGDTLSISRMAETNPQPGISVSKLTQLATGAGVAQQGTTPGSFTGTFADVPLARSQHLAIDLDVVANALPAAPDRTSWGIALLKSPAASEGSIIGPSLLSISSQTIRTGTFEIDETHGTPFDPSWATTAYSSYTAYLPGTTGLLGAAPRYYTLTTEILTSPNHVATLFAGFAGDVLVNGQSLPQATVGASPLNLTVDLPSAAQRFSLRLTEVKGSGTSRTLGPTISIESATPQLELPASALPPGTYHVAIWSSREQGTSYSGAYRDIGTLVVP